MSGIIIIYHWYIPYINRLKILNLKSFFFSKNKLFFGKIDSFIKFINDKNKLFFKQSLLTSFHDVYLTIKWLIRPIMSMTSTRTFEIQSFYADFTHIGFPLPKNLITKWTSTSSVVDVWLKKISFYESVHHFLFLIFYNKVFQTLSFTKSNILIY